MSYSTRSMMASSAKVVIGHQHDEDEEDEEDSFNQSSSLSSNFKKQSDKLSDDLLVNIL